ncbi:hypothetical protein PF005_g18733 [Phytophthora fragariae]|uniref:RxLR effector protein n=1 Tax=Phytophthora fragariae TaxID=53985 RepID=A0A6A3WYJ9_9STRA|nr:hypothetical protein PF003_g5874 [Phytophthora fragariae]KAE8930397.1 hypothetical protein PF009_g19508 [Phytophthora fragariae]KAE8990571.1 hypothetical protein PF011_g18300 [Phytophthora fragariae]KAE9089597.1 hypothetical protein PF010_g18929 [Phytophthora fragariae]KAE9091875.1 hypothetical protein PF007_g18727 [Phytophthora fragariae]
MSALYWLCIGACVARQTSQPTGQTAVSASTTSRSLAKIVSSCCTGVATGKQGLAPKVSMRMRCSQRCPQLGALIQPRCV